MKEVNGHDLNLGDVVKLSDWPYSYATVKNKEADFITFFRPYVRTDDFAYSGGVICYVGIEEFTVPKSQMFHRVLRGEIDNHKDLIQTS